MVTAVFSVPASGRSSAAQPRLVAIDFNLEDRHCVRSHSLRPNSFSLRPHCLRPATSRQRREDLEERSLAYAMAGLCVGWFAAGPVGALVGLACGALIAVR